MVWNVYADALVGGGVNGMVTVKTVRPGRDASRISPRCFSVMMP
jgi:hypothetical protein